MLGVRGPCLGSEVLGGHGDGGDDMVMVRAVMMLVVAMTTIMMMVVSQVKSWTKDLEPQSRCRPSLTNFTSSLRTGFWRCCFL